MHNLLGTKKRKETKCQIQEKKIYSLTHPIKTTVLYGIVFYFIVNIYLVIIANMVVITY